MMKRSWNPRTLVILFVLSTLAFVPLPSSIAHVESGQKSQVERGLLLPGERIILGTVKHVKSGVMQVNIGHLEPLFLS